MRWSELLAAVGTEPVFETGTLLTLGVDPKDVQRQLSRWTAAGDLLRLRRGLYAFGGAWATAQPVPHGYEVANRLVQGSYVSLSTVLAESGLIPEYVPSVTSVTTGRPGTFVTPLGTFVYRHVRSDLFRGYETRDVGARRRVFVAVPEKALVDLLYLARDPDDPAYLRQLRLQNLDGLRLDMLITMAEWTGRRSVTAAVAWVAERALTNDW